MKIINKNKKGFTLIEVLLIVAIFTIILSSSVSLSTTKVFESDLIAKSLEVSDIIERARNHSATGFRGDVWSIKVLDSDALCQNSGDCILLFKGRLFASRDTNYDRFVEFDSDITGVYLNADQENEFYFDYKSGWLATTTASYLDQQQIVLNSNVGKQKSVVVQSTGTVYVFTCGEDKVFDVEGNGYNTVKIGTQCWMSENLNTGTMLAAATDDPADNGSIEKWCYDDTTSNCTSRGGLYDWDELMGYITTSEAQGICPGGWHVPSDPDYETLIANYPAPSAGTALSLSGSSGFNMFMSGERDETSDTYDSLTSLAVFWTSDETTPTTISWAHYNENGATMSQEAKAQNWGFSLRCLKDY